jgi:hypothetical protein
MNPVTSWLFSLMVAFAPPDERARSSQLPGHEETVEQKTARYESIAKDLFDVVYDPTEVPLFAGPKGRARTAALVLAVAYHESGFAHDVDVGPCYRGKDGRGARCDHGKSACVMQLHVGDGTTLQGYTQEELFADRKKCFRAGLGLLRRSFSECRHLDAKHRLNAYASGVCTRGEDGSERLMALMEKFAAKKPLPGDDAAMMKAASSESAASSEKKADGDDAPPKEPPRKKAAATKRR